MIIFPEYSVDPNKVTFRYGFIVIKMTAESENIGISTFTIY